MGVRSITDGGNNHQPSKNTGSLSYKREPAFTSASCAGNSFLSVNPLAAEHPLCHAGGRNSCQRRDLDGTCLLYERMLMSHTSSSGIVPSTRFVLSYGCPLTGLWSFLTSCMPTGINGTSMRRPFQQRFVYPSRRGVHACARHGSYIFGGLRSFIAKPPLGES